MPVASPRRPLNPLLLRRVNRSEIRKQTIALAAGFPNYPEFYETLRAAALPATPLTVSRIQRVAEIVGFPTDEVFLDGEAR